MPIFLRLLIPINFKSIHDNLYENDSNSFKLLKTSGMQINITTPENKTYYETMSGYYPATYGFENDEDNVIPMGWEDNSNYDSYGEIIGEYDGHNKVLGLFDGPTGVVHVDHHFDPQTYGIVEYWFLSTDVTKPNGFILYDDITNAIPITINDGFFRHYDNGWQNIVIASVDTWYHIRVEFECSAGGYLGLSQYTYRLTIDGTDYGTYPFRNNVNQVNMIRCDSGSGIENSNYEFYIDAIGYSWDDNYNIGDNKKEGLLLSFENITTLDWMGYSLDGEANKKILGNTTVPMPAVGPHTIQVSGNDTIGTMYQSDVRYFVVGIIPLSSPKNQTYDAAMNGYYSATYGFENDLEETIPYQWTNSCGSGCLASIKDNNGGHNRVLELLDQNTNVARVGIDFSAQGNGTVEFWIKTSDITLRTYYNLMDSSNNVIATVSFRQSKIQTCIAVGTWLDIYNSPQINTWYRIRIDFEETTSEYLGLSQGKCNYFVYDDSSTLLGSRLNEDDWNSGSVTNFWIGTEYNENNLYSYIDAIGFSWDPNYKIGDNEEEGLLLSFECNLNFNWMGYSLDGQANKTILGNTTIPMPANGPHRIQVFANDSSGLIYKSEILYFTCDVPSPPPPPLPPPPDDDDDGENGEEADFGFWILIILLLILINIGVIAAAVYVIKYRGKKEPKRKKRPPPKKKPREKKKKRIKKKPKKKGVKGAFINCQFCYNKIRGNEQFCNYCGSPLSEKIELSDSTVSMGLDKKKTDFYIEDNYYEKIFLQSSNILKIWIFDAKNKTKLYEETLDPNFSDIEQKYIDINNIINADYEKNKLIEESFEFEKNLIYLYIYASNNPVILVLFSGKKFDKDYFEFIVKTIKGIDENYRDLSDDPLEMKKFLDEHIFLFNSRIFGDIPSSYREMINEIFMNKDEMELVLRDLKNVPKETFLEFLRLHKRLTTELLLEKTRYMINNHNFFTEGFE